MVGLLVLAPLPFGSVTILWRSVLWAACFVALLLALASRQQPRNLRPTWWVVGLLGAFALIGLVQSLPLPDSVVGVVSPNHLELVEEVRSLLGTPDSPRARLTVALGQSISTVLGLAAIAAVFLAAVICGSHRRLRWWVVGAVLATALLEVLFGAQRLFARASTIWGVEVPGAIDRLRGTFVNPDHLATYLLMALAAAFAWSYLGFRGAARVARPEQRLLTTAVPVVCWMVLFVGVAFTGSRAGLLAALAMTLGQGVLLAAALRDWKVAPTGVVVGVLALGVVAWVGLEQGLGRLMATTSYDVAWSARPMIYRASIELWQMFPAFGTGLGTFEVVFPIVQPTEISGRIWSHAHNDWLEILVTGGLVGFSILLAIVVALVRGLQTVLLGSVSGSSRAIALAALGAVMGVGLHEALDFGLTMPGNAVTLAALLGVAFGSSRHYESESIRLIRPGEKGR